ncbi:MAG: SprB repeat-containing protein, partial [Bacteroidales bacterium]|nr:SprB repeat-containing protein [Bacteroidales bacterium]
MKKVFCVLFFFGIIYTINAQSWVSSNIISGNDDISVIKATVLSDNSTIVYGYFTNTIETSSGLSLTSYGSRDYFVAKFNHQNQVDWLKQFGNTGLDYIGGGIAASNNDTIFITGGFQNTLNYPGGGTLVSTGGFDIFFAKMDSDGNVLWCNNIGKGIPHQRPNALQLDENGDVLITGFFTDSIQIDESTTFYSNDGVDDYFINKFNPITGELSWAKQISALNNTLSGRIFETATFTNSYAFVGMYTDSIAFYNLDTIVSANNSPDIHILNTDLNGNINWIRSIKGDNLEYDYAIAADETGDIYVAGYYQSPSLTIDINETETTTVTGNNGDYDFFVAKYSAAGIFQWIKTNGSTGTDKILRMNYFNDEIQVIGLFSDTVQWGGIELTSKGPADQDMFYGSLDLNGNYRSASNYGGRNNSVEEGREIFNKSGELSTVIRSNSDLLILGDSIYLNPAKTYLVAVGTIGCLPINYDYVNETDITACYGDETGAISIGASGGFGGPYQYSNDDGDTYQSNSNFTSLPAGTYNITVKDAENCVESGPEVILTQPTEIAITSVDSSDVLRNGDNSGSINVAATGGTGTIFYSVDNGTTYPSSVGTPTAVTAGVYDVIVKDANNCEMTGPQITIEEPVALTIGSVEQTNVLCNGASTGELIVHASGGTKPYQFSIDDGATYKTDSTFSGLTAGTYTPYVTDANGCLLIGDDITITEPVAVTVTTAHENVQCNGESNGSITITATGDTGPYNFSIDGATYQVESIFGGLSAGTYTIDVEDANGCSWTASDVTITQPDVLSITSAVATDILCSGETIG